MRTRVRLTGKSRYYTPPKYPWTVGDYSSFEELATEWPEGAFSPVWFDHLNQVTMSGPRCVCGACGEERNLNREPTCRCVRVPA